MKPTAPDSLPTAVPASAWWTEFFRPVPIARPGDTLPEAATAPPDAEPVVAICHFRSP